jgi:hypothetical protein
MVVVSFFLFEFVVGTFQFKDLGSIMQGQLLVNKQNSNMVSTEVLPTKAQHNTILEII